MAFFVQSAGDHGDEDELNATINVVPLVDIMLVMLIIFLVTIPADAKPEAPADAKPADAPANPGQ